MKYRVVPTSLNFKIVAVPDPALDPEARTFDVHYDTWLDAHSALMNIAHRKLQKARRELDQAEGYYDGCNSLQEPT